MSSSFRSILQQVTQEKLGELHIQKDLLTQHFSPALTAAESTLTSDPKASLQVLYEALRDTPVKDTTDSILITNLKHVLQNSTQDPSITSQLLRSWIAKVKQEIEHALRKTSYSFLYASLLTEWLALEEQRNSRAPGTGVNLEKSAQEMTAAKKKMEELMTREPSAEEFDSGKFRQFLSSELFSFATDPKGEELLKEIRAETKEFLNVQNDVTITTYDLQACIAGLCAENLMSPEKKAALKELGENSEALDEVASLLTSRLKNLTRWEWPVGPSQNLQIRRGLAGEWKGFLEEDVITALFLQYVGAAWASFFKRQFLRIYGSRIWNKVDPLGNASIEKKRVDFHCQNFLSGLPDSVHSQGRNVIEEYAKVAAYNTTEAISYGDEPATLCNVVQDSQPRMMKRMIRSCPAPPPPAPVPVPPKSDIDFKQSFLHMLSAEIRLNQVIRPEQPLLVVQAEIESFTSTIIHEAVLISLEYFHVPAPWLAFFKKFLQPEVDFGGSGRSRIRTGVPESHILSNLFAEMQNFLLDFHINQTCNGLRVYRMGEEFWFWSSAQADVLKAWETINNFGSTIGLRLNPNRSGSVAIFGEEESRKIVAGPAPLPQKSIHWGYLELHSSGTFKIDQTSIQSFVTEMRALLDRSECALEWINVFNKYAGFFKRNFGKCALIFKKQHLDQIIEALQIIFKELFGSELGCPVSSLKSKFPLLRDTEIVDAWVHWPLERGGLGLVNPFIDVMALREAYIDIADEDHFKNLPAEDKIIFDQMVKAWNDRYGTVGEQKIISPNHGTPPKKPNWEEFLAKRETGNEFRHWTTRYSRLLERPSPKTPSVSQQYWDSGLRSSTQSEDDENYNMWLLTYYEPQLLLHFGTVNFINSKLLPMSMITNIQKSKVQH